MAEPPLLTRLHALLWNSSEGRLRALWRIAGFHACALAAYLASDWALEQWAAYGPVGRSWPERMLILEARQLAVVLLALAFAAQVLDRRPWADFGLGLDGNARADLAFGFALGGLLMTALFVAERAAGWIRFDAAETGASPFAPTLAALLLFTLVGVQEELYFRGYLLRNLAEGLRVGAVGPRAALVAACALSSGVFGLLHLANPHATTLSALAVATAGAMLSLGYLLTARLALPIGLHVAWNFFEGSVYGFPVSGVTGFDTGIVVLRQQGPALWTGGEFGPEAGLLGVLAMLAGMASIAAWVRLRRGRLALCVALTDPPARPPIAG